MARVEKVTDGDYIELESQSSPGTMYRIYALGTPKQYCTCPSWKFSKKPVDAGRTCKHIDELLRIGVVL